MFYAAVPIMIITEFMENGSLESFLKVGGLSFVSNSYVVQFVVVVITIGDCFEAFLIISF